MAWKTSVLVIANQTAPSDELLDHLRDRAAAGLTCFHLVVPATPYHPGVPSGREEARQNLDRALARLRDAGLEVTGEVGDSDPVTAVQEAWDPRRYDEVVVSTLATGASRWLRIDAPRRVERVTGVRVDHVVAGQKREHHTVAPPEHDRHGLLTPLAALSWGPPKRER